MLPSRLPSRLAATAGCMTCQCVRVACASVDLESIRSLANAVTNFEGAVVIVSHDEQLLSLACSQLWHCDGEGGVTQLHYGFDEYKERLRTGKKLDKK